MNRTRLSRNRALADALVPCTRNLVSDSRTNVERHPARKTRMNRSSSS